jgi:hypothetical protein
MFRARSVTEALSVHTPKERLLARCRGVAALLTPRNRMSRTVFDCNRSTCCCRNTNGARGSSSSWRSNERSEELRTDARKLSNIPWLTVLRNAGHSEITAFAPHEVDMVSAVPRTYCHMQVVAPLFAIGVNGKVMWDSPVIESANCF